MSDTKSKTEKDSFLPERLVGLDHWKTTIHDSDYNRWVTGRGNTPEESQKDASDKWQQGEDPNFPLRR